MTGGTGLIGSRLLPRLRQQNDEVLLLTRRAESVRSQFGNSCTIVEGDPTVAGPWMDAIGDCDAVINLAGEPIFGHRWNADFKNRMRESRIRSTENIVAALGKRSATGGRRPVLVNASATGFYGPHGDETLTENDQPGDDFLAHLCVDWERAAQQADDRGIRCAIVRIGVVLAREGGALSAMLPPFKMFAGGPIGSGRQWLSWIHRDDLVGIILTALNNPEASGPINGTAPTPVTNKEFSKELGKSLHRPSFLPTPGFALRLLLGEVAQVITSGQRVLPARAQALGYPFQYPDLRSALANLFHAV